MFYKNETNYPILVSKPKGGLLSILPGKAVSGPFFVRYPYLSRVEEVDEKDVVFAQESEPADMPPVIAPAPPPKMAVSLSEDAATAGTEEKDEEEEASEPEPVMEEAPAPKPKKKRTKKAK